MPTNTESNSFVRQHLLTVEQLQFICRVLFILDCNYDDLLSSSIEDLMVALGLHEDLILINEQQIKAALEYYRQNNQADQKCWQGSQQEDCYNIVLSNSTWKDICLRIKQCSQRYQKYSNQYQNDFIDQLLDIISN
jgi:hypothetical protein